MKKLDQMIGFEKEKKFDLIPAQALDDCHTLKANTVKKIIAHVNPEFVMVITLWPLTSNL